MILALDTATTRGQFALGTGSDVLLSGSFPADQQAGSEIFAALEPVQPYLKDLRWVLVGLGPGSYSGIRVAISAALGIALSRGAKLGGLGSLPAIECEDSPFYVVGDARRKSFFLAEVRDNRCGKFPPDLLSQEELTARLRDARQSGAPVFAWDPRAAELFGLERKFPSAEKLLRLAGEGLEPSPTLEPHYLRPPHITQATRNKPLFQLPDPS
jgi:tRNA threonylcarbamoyl adenosine modification protein YeaZ